MWAIGLVFVILAAVSGGMFWSARRGRKASEDAGRVRQWIVWLTPTFGGIELFLMGLATVLLYATDAGLRGAVAKIGWERGFSRGAPLVIMMGGGLVLSLVSVFRRRKKSPIEKEFMLFFAVVVSAAAGILGGRHLIKGASGVLIVFPLWNIVWGSWVLLEFRLHLIKAESAIVDEVASLWRIVPATGVLVVVLAACRYGFELYWAVTYSICVAYATSVYGAVVKAFGPGAPGDGDVESPYGRGPTFR